MSVTKYKNIILFFVLYATVYGCGGKQPSPEISTESRGYILYVFAKKTEVMIDLCKKDGLTSGTVLEVYKTKIENINEPVKLGEITVIKVGDKMSKAKVSLITSSLKMERGDRVFPRPIIITTDELWITHTTPEKGWKSEYVLPNQRDWKPCQITSGIDNRPSAKVLISDTNAKPIWNPVVGARVGNVYFRRSFQIDANIISATLEIVSGCKTNIYINDNWVGEIKEPIMTGLDEEEKEELPKLERYKVTSLLRKGRNIVAVEAYRDQKTPFPAGLLLAIKVQTGLH
ncbi:MAG: hypothetical protein ACPL7B_01140 [Candidatus Poribacteria bacterium]